MHGRHNASTMSSSKTQDYNAIVGTERDGYTISYICAIGSSVDPVKIPFYYDLVSSMQTPDQSMVEEVAAQLLKQVACQYRLCPDETGSAIGQGCTKPPGLDLTNPQSSDFAPTAWVVGVSSDPPDVLVDATELSCVSGRTGNGMLCSVVKGEMTFYPFSADSQKNVNEFNGAIRSVLSNSSFLENAGFDVYYRGAYLEPSSDLNTMSNNTNTMNNDTSVSASTGDNSVQVSGSSGFTAVGALLVVGVVATVATIVGVILRRRRKRRSRDIDAAVSKSDLEMQYADNGEDSPGAPNVSVLSDDLNMLHISNITNESLDEGHISPDNTSSLYPASYRFDLSDNWKSQVLGTYGPTSMEVVPPYPMEETSDSEVDSWAQTDGTVGSLEERLEEITGEI